MSEEFSEDFVKPDTGSGNFDFAGSGGGRDVDGLVGGGVDDLSSEGLKGSGVVKSNPDLYRKSIKGSVWVFGLRMTTQVLSFVRYILLANLLEVKDFGILGVGLLLMHILERFSDTGFNAALIRKKDDIKGYLNSAWTFGIIRAFVLYGCLFFLARFMVEWRVAAERQGVALDVIRVLGLVMVINSFNNIGVVFFRKTLKFNKLFLIRVSTNLASILVSIVVAVVYRSVWALVAGKIVAEFFSVFLTYWMHSFRPRFDFNFGRIRELWSFGKWMFYSTIQNFVITEGDDLFVMSYLGLNPLAFYQMAYRYSNIPATQIVHVINQVAFPAYSQIQDEFGRLKEAFLKSLRLISCVIFPVSGLIVAASPGFVSNLLKPAWEPIIFPMQILALFGGLRAMESVNGPVLLALNKKKLAVYVSMIKLLLLVLLIYPFAKYWGIVGVSVLVVFMEVVAKPVLDYLVVRLLSMKFSVFAGAQAVPFLSFVSAAGLTVAADIYFVESQLSLLRFLCVLGVYCVCYSVVFLGIEFLTGWKNISLLTSLKSGVERHN